MVKKLLWIEDDSYILEDMIRPLKRSGYEITIVSNAEEALNIFIKKEFDLLLLDIYIPTGLDFGVCSPESISHLL